MMKINFEMSSNTCEIYVIDNLLKERLGGLLDV